MTSTAAAAARSARTFSLVDAWRATRGATAPRFPGSWLAIYRTWRADRLALQRALADFAPIARFPMGPFTVHVASDAASVQEVLGDSDDNYRKSRGLAVEGRPLFGDGLLTSEGDAHTFARKLMAPAFVPKRMAAYGAAMTLETRRSVAEWADGARLDMADQMMRMTLGIVGRTLFDTDVRKDADVIGRALRDAVRAITEGVSSIVQVPYEVPVGRHRRMRRAVAALDSVVYRVLAERRATAGDDRGDVLSTLLTAKDDHGQPIADRRIRDEVMTLMLAGHETTANALTWTLYALAREPHHWDALTAEVDRALDGKVPAPEDMARLPTVCAAIDEAMRLWPPAMAIGRQAQRAVTLGGHQLGPGAFVMVNIYGLHHRADVFPEPDRFDPSRMLPAAKKARPRGAYLPFGAGPRVCIGNHFALLEAQLALTIILQSVRLELADPSVPPVPEPMVTLRPRDGLPMIVRRRRDAPATRLG